MTKKSLTVIITGLLLTVFQFPILGAKSDAVVKIVCTSIDGSQRSGSGVCIDNTGVILTAAHVVRIGSCRVHFSGEIYPATPVLIPDKEAVAILKIHADQGLPFLEVAESEPTTGDPVWVMGYPSGEWNSFQTEVTSTNLFFTNDPSTQLIGVFDPVLFGTSGGPLVTENWKVAGIASVSGKIPQAILGKHARNQTAHISGTALNRTGGMFLALRHVKEAYQTYLASHSEISTTNREKPVLHAFTSPQCSACKLFKQDFHAGKYSAFDVRLIEQGSSKWAHSAIKSQRTTAKQIPDSVPFFWIEGSREYVQQQRYHAPGLLQILLDIVKSLGKIVHNPPSLLSDDAMLPELNDNQSNLPLPQPESGSQPSEPDWSGIQIILLAAKQEVGLVRNQIRKQALTVALGPVRRKLAETTGGRINFEVISERLTPLKYSAVIQAAEISPRPVAIIVLVPRQSVGFTRGLIVKKIENAIIGKLNDAPIDLIFERIHPGDYVSIRTALQTQERAATKDASVTQQPGEPQPTDQDPLSPRHTIPTLAVAWLAERITTRLKRRFAT